HKTISAMLRALGERANDTTRLKEAIAAFRQALKERTRERVPLDWAMTQNNFVIALSRLGKRESGTAWLEEAVEALRGAIEVAEKSGATHYMEVFRRNLTEVQALLSDRQPKKA